MVNKITVGFVIQKFDENGKFVSQEFTAGDQCDLENEDGEPVDESDFDCEFEYAPYEMKNRQEIRQMGGSSRMPLLRRATNFDSNMLSSICKTPCPA